MKKVFVTREILEEGILKLKEHGLKVEIWEGLGPIPTNILYEKASESVALITMLSDTIDQKFLETNSHLKVITNYAVGTNNIDKETARKLNIVIGNTPDVLTDATAEIALGLMISCARNFKAASENASQGRWKTWEPKGFIGMSLKNKTLGILGNGRIGQEMARLCSSAFLMDVKIFKRGDSLEDFLRDLDVLSIHVPLTSDTKNMIGKKELSAMKKTAIIINTARGEILDQEALYQALVHNQLFAAGLDVTEPEPLSSSHPLFTLSNVLILPHIGSATFDARIKMSLLCAENIIKHI